MPEPKTKCTKCNVVILQTTADRNMGNCAPCSSGRKKKRTPSFSRREDRAQNWWETLLTFSVIIPVVFGSITGEYISDLCHIDDINLPRDWHGIDFVGIINQIVWIPFAILYIQLWRYLIYLFRLLPADRARKFPFGATFGNE